MLAVMPVKSGLRSYGGLRCVILTAGLDKEKFIQRKVNHKPAGHVFKSVNIGEGVWLGANSMIMPGVNIAPRIIVLPGAIVTNNIEKEGWMYGGIPARPIKQIG